MGLATTYQQIEEKFFEVNMQFKSLRFYKLFILFIYILLERVVKD